LLRFRQDTESFGDTGVLEKEGKSGPKTDGKKGGKEEGRGGLKVREADSKEKG
jgi:hypothetical protein